MALAVVVGAEVAAAGIDDVIAGLAVVVAEAAGFWLVAAGAPQPMRKEINIRVKPRVKIVLDRVPDPFSPSVKFFPDIFLTLL